MALLILTAVWPAADVIAAEGAESIELRVKAAFLYKFASYVEWPESAFAQPETPFTIAVIGADPIATELKQVVFGRSVNGRPVTVRQFRPGESIAGVHILFFGSSVAPQLGSLLKAVRPFPVLTVTESEGALAEGSVINFVLIDQRVRFEISRESASRSKLRLSSRLLAVAQHVTEER
ncbi:MAG: YfiR family protein [Rhodanobacter sp.]